MNTDFYGRGIGYPFRLDAARIGESAGVQKVEESILVILGTQYGQRIMRPDFGCNLASLAFAPNDVSTAHLAGYYVREGLTRWEPRIEVVDVTVDNDNLKAALLITVTYRLLATQDIRNLVYPFYLESMP